MVVHFREDASPEFDSHADTWKIPNTHVNIFSLAGTNKFAINSRETLSCQTEVTLGISQVKAGSYSLEFSEFESFDNQVAITLIDKFTNTTHNARTGNYEFSVTADPASHGHSRFVIRFERAIDSTLSIAAPAVCGDQAATIIIESAQVGVKYFVQKNGMAISDTLEGNGDNLSLQIASEHLLAGENTLVVISYLPCSQVERSVIVQVGATPIITSTTPGQTCGSGTVTLEAVASSPEALFNWYDSESATEPVSSNSSGIFATPALQKSRMYYVSAVAAQGCEGERVGVLASVINLTPVTIVQQGNFLVSNYTAGNQWYLNGAALANETQQRLKAKDDGLYSVEVTTQNCKTSAEFEVTGNKNHASELSSLRVFPNPVVDIMILEYEDASEIKSMKLTNSMGREVAGFELKWDENSSRTEIDLKSLDPGIYILKVYGVDKTRTFKVIKK
jgi:hypothetical protein